MKSKSQKLKEEAEKKKKEALKKVKRPVSYKAPNPKQVISANKKKEEKKKQELKSTKKQNLVISVPKLVIESTPLSISRKAALNAYASKKSLIEKASSTKKIMEIVKQPLWYDEIFTIPGVPKSNKKTFNISGKLDPQKLLDQLECEPETPTVIYTPETLSKLKVNNSKINEVTNLIKILQDMNDNLKKNGVVTDDSSIKQLKVDLENLNKEQEKIINQDCLEPPAEEVKFDVADYSCPVPPIPNPFKPTPEIEKPTVTPNDIKYPTDFPKDCYDQLEKGMKSIVSEAQKFGNSVQKIEQMRKRYYLTKIIYDLEASNLKLYKRIVKLMDSRNNELSTFGQFYLSDKEVLKLFDNNIGNLNVVANSKDVTKDINRQLERISTDYDYKSINIGGLHFSSFTIKREPPGINWFTDKIIYKYFDRNNIAAGKLDAYFLFSQTEPTAVDKINFQKDPKNATAWIKKREKAKKKLLDEIDVIVNSITKPMIKSNMSLFFSKFRRIQWDENLNPYFVNVFDSGIRSHLKNEIRDIETRISFYSRFIDEFDSLNKFQDEFEAKMKTTVDKLTTIPCLASAPDSNTDNKFNDRNDDYYLANPTMPFLDKLSYWKKFASMATIAGLLPTHWAYGLVIPNPSGLIGVSMPIVWLPVAVIPTPIGIYVIFIGQCGIMPAPYVYHFSGVSLSSGFLLSLRGSSDFLKIKPALIRGKTKSMVIEANLKSLLKVIDMHLDAPNLKFESTSDQKKFIEFPASDPTKDPNAAGQLSQVSAFSSVLPKLLQSFTKTAFGSGKTGTKGSDLASKISKKTFIQDDLPAFDRLNITNAPFMLYAAKFASIGSYCGGIPMSVPSSPKINQKFPSALSEIPETFL